MFYHTIGMDAPACLTSSDSFLRWVKMCILVLLNHTKKGLLALACLSIKFLAAPRNSSIHRRHTLGVKRARIFYLSISC